jgi:hypothetical protein
MGRAGGLCSRQDGILSSAVILAKNIVLVDNMKLDLIKRFLVSGKLVQEIPPHGVHIGLANFFRQLLMVPI